MEQEADGKKKHFKDYFSGNDAVDLWEKVYAKDDIGGGSVKKRLEQTLAWFDELGLPGGAAVLDAGSGAGMLSREIMSRGFGVVAMDYSLGMLEKTRNLCQNGGNPGVTLAQGDVEAIPFKDESLDAVISLGVVSYLRTIDKALREFARVLKPGGVLIFSTLNKVNIVGYFDIPVMIKNIARKIAKRRKKEAGGGKTVSGEDAAHKRLFFTPRVVKSMRGLGFRGVEYKTIPYRLLTFNGKDIRPKRLNLKIVLALEKIPALPVIGPMGGLCLFKGEKKQDSR